MLRRIDVVSTIDIYEIDGSETIPDKKDGQIQVKNHWNHRNLIILCVPGKKSITVNADDLIRAIRNAQNAHAY